MCTPGNVSKNGESPIVIASVGRTQDTVTERGINKSHSQNGILHSSEKEWIMVTSNMNESHQHSGE